MSFIKKRWQKYKANKRWWSIALDFIFLALIVAMIFPASRKEVSAFMVRQTLLSPRASSNTTFLSDDDWSFRVVDNNGKVVELSELKGAPIFVNYWATWCPPCIAEMPSIQNLYDNYNEKVHFLFVNNEDPAVVRSFMDKHNYDLPLHNIVGRTPDLFETSTLPTTIVISPKGRVVLYKTGAARWDSNKMFKTMDEMIEDK